MQSTRVCAKSMLHLDFNLLTAVQKYARRPYIVVRLFHLLTYLETLLLVSLAGQTFAHKTGWFEDISITLPKCGSGQSDRGTGNRVYSAICKCLRRRHAYYLTIRNFIAPHVPICCGLWHTKHYKLNIPGPLVQLLVHWCPQTFPFYVRRSGQLARTSSRDTYKSQHPHCISPLCQHLWGGASYEPASTDPWNLSRCVSSFLCLWHH